MKLNISTIYSVLLVAFLSAHAYSQSPWLDTDRFISALAGGDSDSNQAPTDDYINALQAMAGTAYQLALPAVVAMIAPPFLTLGASLPAAIPLAAASITANVASNLEQPLQVTTGYEPRITPYNEQYNVFNLPYQWIRSKLNQAKDYLLADDEEFKANFKKGMELAKPVEIAMNIYSSVCFLGSIGKVFLNVMTANVEPGGRTSSTAGSAGGGALSISSEWTSVNSLGAPSVTPGRNPKEWLIERYNWKPANPNHVVQQPAQSGGGAGGGAAVAPPHGLFASGPGRKNRPKVEAVGWTKKEIYDAAVQEVADETFPHQHKIIKGLWLGDKQSAGIANWIEVEEKREHEIGGKALNFLRKNDIGGILSILIEPEKKFENNGIQYFEITIEDDPTPQNNEILLRELPKAFEFIRGIQAKGQSVLVHCQFGSSRSATALIAFMMEEEKRTFKNVLDEVVAIRPLVRPIFFDFLVQHEQMLRDRGFELTGESSEQFLPK